MHQCDVYAQKQAQESIFCSESCRGSSKIFFKNIHNDVNLWRMISIFVCVYSRWNYGKVCQLSCLLHRQFWKKWRSFFTCNVLSVLTISIWNSALHVPRDWLAWSNLYVLVTQTLKMYYTDIVNSYMYTGFNPVKKQSNFLSHFSFLYPVYSNGQNGQISEDYCHTLQTGNQPRVSTMTV